MTSPRVPHILIVGGGFGGVYAAKTLIHELKTGEARVTLMSEHNYFLFAPLLHEVATGGLSLSSVAEPLLEVFRETCVSVVTDTLISLDAAKKTVMTGHGAMSFDYLILATGARSNIDIPINADLVFPLKTLEDALAIRKGIITLFQTAASQTMQTTLSFAVIGAGHTGTEAVMELSDFVNGTLGPYYVRTGTQIPDIQISLIGDSETPVPYSDSRVQKAATHALKRAGIHFYQNAKAASISKADVLLANGIRVPANLVLWTAGTVPTLMSEWKLPLTKDGRIDTDEFLRVRAFSDIFAIGDVAGKDARLAQVAEAQGIHSAKNIVKILRNITPTPFLYRTRGFLMSLGRGNATGNIFGIPIAGPWGWWIWRTVYLFKFLSWRKRFRIALEWTIRLFMPRDITIL